MDNPTDEGWRAAQPQRAAVLLRVTCVKGYWKGAAHYHHILPPPEGSDQAWFDHGKFLKNTTSPRGIVRIATKCLVSDRSRIDEALEGLIEGVIEELKNIYEEDIVMTGDWVALRNDSDGEMVSCFILVCCLERLSWGLAFVLVGWRVY